jgi:hypothetical protein
VAILWYAKQLQLATVGGHFLSMAEKAVKEKQDQLSGHSLTRVPRTRWQ